MSLGRVTLHAAVVTDVAGVTDVGDVARPRPDPAQVAAYQLHLAAEDLRCAEAALPGGWPIRQGGPGSARAGGISAGGPAQDAADTDADADGCQRVPVPRLPERADIEFALLGCFRVQRDGLEIPASAFGGRRARQLVQILLRERGRLVPRDVLVDALWPAAEPADPGANLAVLASRARRALGESSLILASQGGYVFADDARCWVDAEAFAAAADRGRMYMATGHAGAALRSYRRALALWAGEPFAESLYEEWAQGHRRLFARLYEESLDGAARAALQLSQASVAVHFATILTERVPLHEEGRLVLMRALAEAGDPAAAIELFHAWRSLLAEELGLDPCAEMSELYQRIVDCAPAPRLAGPEKTEAAASKSAVPGLVAGLPDDGSDAAEPAWEIVDWISDAAFVLDPRARFLYINRRGADLAGHPASTVVGRPVREICTEEWLPGFSSCAEAALALQAPSHFRGFCPPADAWLDVVLYPGRRGLLAVLRDATRQVLAEEQVHLALAEVEASRRELECLATRE
ncbi:MAG: BTAD domain-containing putative transcriptional regulator [Streptosporangiaceae bacterium]